jgi:hypothetical protein
MKKTVLFYLVSAALVGVVFIVSRNFGDKKEEVNKTVEVFLEDLNMKNYSNIEKRYPDFKKILKHKIISNYKINNVILEGDYYSVYVTNLLDNTGNSNVMFKIKKVNGEYLIQESKGLSAYIGMGVYDFFLNIGCIKSDLNDIDISAYCNDNESKYNSLIEGAKKQINDNVIFNSSNLSQNNGLYITGNLIIKNNSKFNIPANSYNVDFGFINTNTSEAIDRQPIQGFKPEIPSNSTISIQVNYVPINGGNKFGPLFKMKDDELTNNALNKEIIALGLDCEKWKSYW